MKNNLLTVILFLFFAALPQIISAATRPAGPANSTEEAVSAGGSKKESKKLARLMSRLNRLEKKLQKKAEKLHRKGKSGGNMNLGFIGLVVLLFGGLFILLGIAIPVVGILFIFIGGVVAIAGLLLMMLLGGISVNMSEVN